MMRMVNQRSANSRYEATRRKEMKNRSGKLLATNDFLIEELINDTRYHINEDGTIWTTVQRTGKDSKDGTFRILKQSNVKRNSDKEYGKVKYKYHDLAVHRIVYAAFVGKLEYDLTVNHKDGNTLNNHYSNLELITQSENNKHRYAKLKLPPCTGARKLTYEGAQRVRTEYSTGNYGYGKLARKYGVSKNTIGGIVKGKTYNSP